MDKLKKALSGREDQEDEERGFVSQVLEIFYQSVLYLKIILNLLQALDASSLSWGTRVKGFCICFGIGVLMSVLGSLVLALGPLGGNLKLFAILYTVGNMMAIGRLGIIGKICFKTAIFVAAPYS